MTGFSPNFAQNCAAAADWPAHKTARTIELVARLEKLDTVRDLTAQLIPRVVDIDLFHRREIRHRVGAVRAVERVPQAGRDAPGDEFLPAFGAPGHATRRVAPLARYGLYRAARRA